MSSRPAKPRWWLAYSLFFVLALLLVLIEWLSLAPTLKEVAQIASVIFTLTLLYLWAWANADALNEEWRTQARQTPPAPTEPVPTPEQRHYRRVMQFHHLAKPRHTERDCVP
ncbi:MAG: hypothetical protein H0T73_10455 [Ardenticatenales bacterium]|nr:hypothetical protein [Ardenticatenales bacterium]